MIKKNLKIEEEEVKVEVEVEVKKNKKLNHPSQEKKIKKVMIIKKIKKK